MESFDSLKLKEVCSMLYDSTNDRRLLYANKLSETNPGIDISGLDGMQNKRSRDLKDAIIYYKDFIEAYIAIPKGDLSIDFATDDIGSISHKIFSWFRKSLEQKVLCADKNLNPDDNTKFFFNLLTFYDTEYYKCDDFETGRYGVPRGYSKSSYIEQNIYSPIRKIINNSDEIKQAYDQFNEKILCLSADSLREKLNIGKGELKLVSQLMGLNLFKHKDLDWMISNSNYTEHGCGKNIRLLLDYLNHGEGTPIRNIGMEGRYLGILPIGEEELKNGMAACNPELSKEDKEMIIQILKNTPYFECLDEKFQIKWKHLGFEAKKIRILADNPGEKFSREKLMKEFNSRCESHKLRSEKNTALESFKPRANRYPFVRSENGYQWIDNQNPVMRPMEAIRSCLEEKEPASVDVILAFCRNENIRIANNSISRTYLPQIATRILNQEGQSMYVLKEHRGAFINKGYRFPEEDESRTDVLPVVVSILKKQPNREIKYLELCQKIKELGFNSNTLRKKLERYPDVFHFGRVSNSNRIIISLTSNNIPDFSVNKSRKSDLLPRIKAIVDAKIEENGGKCSLEVIVSEVGVRCNIEKVKARALLRDNDLRQQFNFIHDASHKRTTVQKKSDVDNSQHYSIPLNRAGLKHYFLTQIEEMQIFNDVDCVIKNMYSIMGLKNEIESIDNRFHDLLIALPSYTTQTLQRKNEIREKALQVLEPYLKLYYEFRFDKNIIDEISTDPDFLRRKPIGLAVILAYLSVKNELPNEQNNSGLIQRNVQNAARHITYNRNMNVGHATAIIDLNERKMSQQIHDVFLIMLYLASRVEVPSEANGL